MTRAEQETALRSLCMTADGRTRLKSAAFYLGIEGGRKWGEIPESDLALLHRYLTREIEPAMSAEQVDQRVEELAL